MKRKIIFEENHPNGWVQVKGSDEISQAKSKGCKVEQFDDGLFYDPSKCTTNKPEKKEEPNPQPEVSEVKCPPDDSYVEYKDEFTNDEIKKKKKEEKCKFIQCKDTKKKYYSCPKKEEPKNQGTEGEDVKKGGETDKEESEVKYPREATQDEIKSFESVPCLNDLPTKVTLNKDGEETLYKVEVTGIRTIFYYEPYQDGSNEGVCVIDEGGKKTTQYYHCPEKK